MSWIRENIYALKIDAVINMPSAANNCCQPFLRTNLPHIYREEKRVGYGIFNDYGILRKSSQTQPFRNINYSNVGALFKRMGKSSAENAELLSYLEEGMNLEDNLMMLLQMKEDE